MNIPKGGIPSPSAQRKRLPVNPSLEHLQKQAKRRVKQNPPLTLAAAQHQLAKEYGCKNWAELAHVVETMSRGADQLAYVKFKPEPLPQAARAGDWGQVREILTGGTFTQHDLDQALAHCLWYGDENEWPERKAIADLLLEHGADPDGQYGSGYGPIVFGTAEGLQPDRLQYLIDAGADVTFPPIETKYGPQSPYSHTGTYVRGRNERKHRYIDILLAHNACLPPEVTPPILAIHRGDAQGLARLLDADPGLVSRRFPDMPYGNIALRGATLLHCAVEFGEIACVDELLKRHADINAKADIIDGIGGQTPIFHAINTNCDGNFYTLEYLAKKAGPRIDFSVRATWRSYGEVQAKPMTPLEYAESGVTDEARKWRKKIEEEREILRSLTATKMDVSNDIALWRLCQSDAPDPERLVTARRLLDDGANPNHRCEGGSTALHAAARRGPAEMVELLLSRGAQNWITDDRGKIPLDEAKERPPSIDREAIIKRISQPRIDDPHFRAAVDAMTTGDLETLQRLLGEHPGLATARAEENGEYAGPYFSRPYLLEFVAENPIRTRKLPPNIAEIAQAIIDAGSPREALDKAIGLAASGCVPRECGVQAPLLELLVENGAEPSTGLDGAISQGEQEAATIMLRLMLRSGIRPSLLAAAGLGDGERVRELLERGTFSLKEKESALHAALRYDRRETVRLLLESGLELNREMLGYGTPLHYAALFGHQALCDWLIARGADPAIADSQWQGTPAGWAHHNGHPALAARLREAEGK